MARSLSSCAIHKRVNSFIDGSAFCPGPLNRVPSDSEKHLHVYTSSGTMSRHVWRVDTTPGQTHKKTDVRRSTVETKIAGLHVYGIRCEVVNPRKISIQYLNLFFLPSHQLKHGRYIFKAYNYKY